MKKVRKKDLEYLIASSYWEFIDPEHKPINDIINGHGNIQIRIDSICIRVTDFSGLFAEENIKNIIMGEFAKNIEEMTFGNLKVTRMRDNEILIANAYEVIN